MRKNDCSVGDSCRFRQPLTSGHKDCKKFEPFDYWYYFLLSGMRDIQAYTRESLRRRLRNYLSNDWLPVNKSKSFPLKRFYVELNWTKTIKGLQDTQEPMNRIHDIFTLNIGSSAVTVLVRGASVCYHYRYKIFEYLCHCQFLMMLSISK